MKKRVLKSLTPLASRLPLEWLLRISGQKLFLPFYHSVQKDQPLTHIRHLYELRSLNTFEKDLDFLLKYYTPLDLSTLYQHLQTGKPFEKHSFFLSFDDGLREVYDHIAPLLLKKGIPASFFLNSAFVDNRALFFRYKASLLIEELKTKNISSAILKQINVITDHQELNSVKYQNRKQLDEVAQILEFSFSDFLKEQQPYMTTVQIKDLQGQGFNIGAHSVDHPLYKDLSVEQQIKQTQESQEFVVKQFGSKVKAFAFPFTDDGVSAQYFEIVKKKGITNISFGTAGLKQDSTPFHLQRFPVEAFPFNMHELVSSEYFYYFGKAFLGKNKIHRK